MTLNKSDISKYFSDINKRRKNKVGGFSDPEVRKKALENREAKRVQPEKPILPDSQTGKE